MTIISSHPPVPGVSLPRAAPPLESGGLLEGEQLGQFLLQKFIGGGGMGVVFRALDTTLNREVAVKVLSRDQSTDDEALRRFRNEAQSAARLNHENIARVHYVGEDRGVHYIVFEYIEGENLRDRIEQNGPLPLAEAISYTYQIAAALDHASQRDVIHRDIKPSNVLITPEGTAKLVDMGLARLNQVAQADNDLTASGVTLGTFDYISPEQARDPRSADVRSDLYSLGCSFFFMLTGRPPFPDGTVLQKLLQHQADHAPDPRSVRPELPVEVTWILARLLAKNPSQRFQHPSELTAQLAALGAKLGLQLSAPRTIWTRPRPRGPISRWRRHVPWIVPLAALFLIVLALDYHSSSDPGAKEVVGPSSPDISAAAPGRSSKADGAAERPVVEPRGQLDKPAPLAAPLAPSRQIPEPGAVTPAAEPSAEALSGADPSDADAARDNRTFGANLSLEGLRARASAAAKAISQVGPEPAGARDETGISGASATPSKGTAPAAPNAAAPREGLLVVSGTETGDRIYASLHAACNNAKSGDVIELRYNGRRLEEPITISNKRLTIRAGEQFQPVVVFRPEPNPVKYPPSMLSVAGGQLTVANVHWELDVPRDLGGDWALIETRRADLLRFDKCTFTVRNASLGQAAFHPGLAFFDIKAPPGSGAMAMDQAAQDDHIVTIDLQNCLARGEAAFVRDNELQPLRLHWDNGLLATSERLLVAAGGPSQPRLLGYVHINLRHVTAMLRSGLVLLTNSEDAPYQLQTDIHCTDSILASAAGSPLIEQRGSDSVEEYIARMQWSGDHDYFDGVDEFWRIVNAAAQTTAKQTDFEQWQQFWSGRSRSAANVPVSWRHPPSSDRPFHAHTPDDYALDFSAADNPAVGGASDGLDAGCVAKQLSTLPPDDAADAAGARSQGGPPQQADDDM